MKTKALIVTDINKVELGEVSIADPGPDQVLIRSIYTCISPGTELRAMAGKQDADCFPYVPGYALVGVVENSGSDSPLKEGQRVFTAGTVEILDAGKMWGGHIEYAVADAESISIIPENVSDRDAALAAMGGIAYHGYKLSRPKADDDVAVVGLGVLGQLCARYFTNSCRTVGACDLSEARVEVAKNGGVNAKTVEESPFETLKDILPEGADIVVDVTGAPPVLPQALALTRQLPWTQDHPPGPRFIVQGSYPADFSIPYNDAFMNEVSFMIPRNYVKSDRDAYLQLLESGEINIDGLVGKELSPENSQDAYDELSKREPAYLTAVFKW